MGSGKRQAHHRVLQPLALVHGHHLDQIGIALQADDLLLATAPSLVNLHAQPAHQSLLAIQLRAGVLKQLGQMQEIGQTPLAPRLRQPPRRQRQAVQGLAQHGQHALVLPHPMQFAQ